MTMYHVVPDRHCGLLVQRQPVREVGKMEQHQSAQDEAPHSDFLMLVQDDSMKNAGIRAGDRVEIAACDHVEPGQIALVKVGEEYLLRVLWADGQILAPANPAYMAEVFTRDELAGVQIIGRAVAVRHTLK